MTHLPALSVALLATLAFVAHGSDFPALYNSEPDTASAPMPAEKVAAEIKMPPGFKATVFAAEPDVQNPLALAWDPRGRLWIAENFTYSERAKKIDLSLRDRVLIFDDPDGDGRFNTRKVFTDDVQVLTSVEVGLGGVWLMCPPQLLFIPDRNGDDVPDAAPEVVLDGFTLPPENYHNFANGLRWGPDGWLYGRCGASAPGKVGAPGTPAAERVPLAGGIWRYHPQRKVFEALCHGTTNPWGHDWNEYGEMFFTNTVNGHLWHMIPGAHFTRPHTIDPNPHVYALMDQIADHYHFDTGKGWQASRDGKANDLGGGHAHCGAMIYLGDNWPDEYRGKLFTLNFHGRRMNVERLERHGSGYIAKHDADMFEFPDPWFRGLDLSYGPDGGVFVLDWSDTGECHENNGVHRTSGRIYKIVYSAERKGSAGASPAVSGAPAGNIEPRPGEAAVSQKSEAAGAQDESSAGAPKTARGARALPISLANLDVSKLANDELVKLHEHKNEWFVRMARRLAMDRGMTLPSPGLDSENELTRAAALARSLDQSPLDAANGKIRAIQPLDSATIVKLRSLAETDPSAKVRLALVSALARLPAQQRIDLATALVARGEDAADRDIPLLTWHALSALDDDPATRGELVAIARSCRLPLTRRLIARRIAGGSGADPRALDALISVASRREPEYYADILNGISEGFTGWRKAPQPVSWHSFSQKISESGDAALVAKARELSVLFGDGRALDDVKKLALDDKAALDARKAALRSLIDAKPPDLREVCEKLLGVRFLNTVAARGLAQFDDPAIGEKLAKSYRSFHPSERAAVLETLVSRPVFANALLGEIAAGKIPRTELTAFHARQIRSFNDAALTARLSEVWGELRESAAEKRALIDKLKSQLTPAVLAGADKSQGRALYNTLCASCHTLYGQGGQLGPDLTGSNRDNLDYLLENLIDPSGVVTADFRMTVVNMKDGRVFNGMIAQKTDRTITLKTMTETVTLERAEIAGTQEMPMSLMPEGLVEALSDEQRRDLFAYLMSRAQAPLPNK